MISVMMNRFTFKAIYEKIGLAQLVAFDFNKLCSELTCDYLTELSIAHSNVFAIHLPNKPSIPHSSHSPAPLLNKLVEGIIGGEIDDYKDYDGLADSLNTGIE